MIVKYVELKNFRNYENLHLDFTAGTNIFFGDNAQGKTNLLESLYVSSTTKSHRSVKDREMIRFDEQEAHIRTVLLKKEKEYQIDIHLKKNKAKGIAVNKIPIKKASELLGLLNIVFFSPEDLNIIKNGPAERRHFLDLELCQLDKIYLYHLSKYNRILEQRNRLLKDIIFRPDLASTLPVWNDQLIKYGCQIIRRRKKFVKELSGIVRKIHGNISGGRENLTIFYEADTGEEDFGKKLKESEEKDLRTGSTNVGPHRDDLLFMAEEIDLRKFGSQGQQRTCALSLKLSEIELMKQANNDNPVLLLDDVLSELDSKRQNYLLNNIHDIQTLITCTGLEEFVKMRFPIDKVFQIEKGKVKTYGQSAGG